MPLYMDRHDVPGASKRDVAAAHLKDVELADEFGVDFLSYWFDESVGGAFCFAEAPSADRIRAIHEASHGLVPNEIIAVSEDEMLRFLGGIHTPRNETEVTSPIRTVVFTDLVGSTAFLTEHGEARYLEFIGVHDSIVRRALIRHHGREVKHTGDGIMAAFDESADAARWAVDCLESFHRHETEPRPVVRIGLASGIPVDHNDDIYGEAVVLASRLCDHADPDTALASDAVRKATVGIGLSFMGPVMARLKGFPDPVPAFRLVPDGDDDAATAPPPSPWARLRARFRR